MSFSIADGPTMAVENDRLTFWYAILASVGTQPRDTSTVRGASGIDHPLNALGLDRERNRMVIISREHEARLAALMQADIQAAFPSLSVIVARPITFNLAKAIGDLPAEFVSSEESNLGSASGLVTEVTKRLMEQADFLGSSTVSPSELAGLSGMHEYFRVNHELWTGLGIFDDSARTIFPLLSSTDLSRRMKQLSMRDPTEEDRRFGVCPIPLYDFGRDELEACRSAGVNATVDILKRHNIFQYFFPAPDQLALGLVEREQSLTSTDVVSHIGQAPELGHPFGPTEITEPHSSISSIVDDLIKRNLVVEGEYGLEVTSEGKTIRSTVRFKPREGLLSKILNRISINLDLKDLFRGS